jgi:hypothetical protein
MYRHITRLVVTLSLSLVVFQATPRGEARAAEDLYTIQNVGVNGTYFYVMLDHKIPDSPCLYPERAVLPLNTPGSNAIQTVLMAAYLAGKKVNFDFVVAGTATDRCTGYGALRFTYVRTSMQ